MIGTGNPIEQMASSANGSRFGHCWRAVGRSCGRTACMRAQTGAHLDVRTAGPAQMRNAHACSGQRMVIEENIIKHMKIAPEHERMHTTPAGWTGMKV
ncbi:unnamed protein product [Echinostoma caproni]|uniref:Uncharacterized protein n=1 Tax=Echinostoma caproni TaxID=27848 RepID=A0A183ABN7_9TREM|nr:unnamed protein product [Echinostoma caproni]